MKHRLSEKKVLKKLGIPDFRHMTKDKVMGFASMLNQMDPEVAKKALEKGIQTVVFDRGGYVYHGRVAALAEAAREAGLKF